MWVTDVGLNHSRNIPRASAAEAGGDRDVLLSSRGKRHRKSLDAGAEACLPEDLASIRVHGAEVAVQVADERLTGSRGKRGGEIGGALRRVQICFMVLTSNAASLPTLPSLPGIS